MVAVAALSLAVAACGGIFTDEGITDSVRVQNNTNLTLHFKIIKVDGKLFDLYEQVAPGGRLNLLSGGQLAADEGLMVDRCTVGDVIAYDPSGREVARHPPPLCARTHDVWTIGPAGSPTPSGYPARWPVLQVGLDRAGGVGAGRAGDAATGVAARAGQVEAGDGGAVAAEL